MSYIKQLLILCVILITIIILWFLYQERLKIGHKQENFSLFSSLDSKIEREINYLKSSSNVTITNINQSLYSRPIREFCVKGAYNAAVTGKYVNKDMVAYVLSRGCRYLDFEVFSIDNTVQVAYTSDPKFETVDTECTVSLFDILSIVSAYAFSSKSPNMNDPLFIQFHIKTHTVDIYKNIAQIIQQTIGDQLYQGKITPATPIGDLLGKIVLVFNKTIDPNYLYVADCKNDTNETCVQLSKYVNLESGTINLYIYYYSTLLTQPGIQINSLLDVCDICTDLRTLRIALPDIEYNKIASNVLAEEYITKYGCQWLPMKFYSYDDGLMKYENVFNAHKTAFIPMSAAIKYFADQKVPTY